MSKQENQTEIHPKKEKENEKNQGVEKEKRKGYRSKRGEIIVSLRSPRLRKIRNNLRKLWLAVYRDEHSKILKKEHIVSFKKSRTLKSGETDMELHKQRQDLQQVLEQSIIFCPKCGKADKDMIKTSYKQQWVCLDCYAQYHKWFKEELESIKDVLRARTKLGYGLPISRFGEEHLVVPEKYLRKKFKEWGGIVDEEDMLHVPKGKIDSFLDHLDEIECTWI